LTGKRDKCGLAVGWVVGSLVGSLAERVPLGRETNEPTNQPTFELRLNKKALVGMCKKGDGRH
jgi:hypothetical protein